MTVRILLPPSEAKHPRGRGRPIGSRPPHPTLGAARERTIDALIELTTRPDAAAALLVPPSAAPAALEADATVRTAPTLPALRRYAGVVYDGLGFAALTPDEQRLAARSTFVFSGLFGVVRGDEPVPDYRVPAKAVLPGLGVAGTFWRPILDDVMPGLLGRGLVVDLRSSDYASMWRPRGAVAARTVSVRVLSPLPGGGRGVVSYASKYAKGMLTAALVRRVLAGGSVEQASDIAAAWLADGGADAEVVDAQHVVVHTLVATGTGR